MSKRRYRRGEHIMLLDQLCQQELVYWRDKIQSRKWLMSWQMSMTYKYIGENGSIYYAIPITEDGEGGQSHD